MYINLEWYIWTDVCKGNLEGLYIPSFEVIFLPIGFYKFIKLFWCQCRCVLMRVFGEYLLKIFRNKSEKSVRIFSGQIVVILVWYDILPNPRDETEVLSLPSFGIVAIWVTCVFCKFNVLNHYRKFWVKWLPLKSHLNISWWSNNSQEVNSTKKMYGFAVTGRVFELSAVWMRRALATDLTVPNPRDLKPDKTQTISDPKTIVQNILIAM